MRDPKRPGHGRNARAVGLLWLLLAGIEIAFMMLMVPLVFVSGLSEAFKSSVWTLAYREVVQLNGA